MTINTSFSLGEKVRLLAHYRFQPVGAFEGIPWYISAIHGMVSDTGHESTQYTVADKPHGETPRQYVAAIQGPMLEPWDMAQVRARQEPSHETE
jgi:hypothetical protein